MIEFIIGAFIGAMIGVIAMAIIASGKMGDIIHEYLIEKDKEKKQ